VYSNGEDVMSTLRGLGIDHRLVGIDRRLIRIDRPYMNAAL